MSDQVDKTVLGLTLRDGGESYDAGNTGNEADPEINNEDAAGTSENTGGGDEGIFEYEGEQYTAKELQDILGNFGDHAERAGKYDELLGEFTRRSQELAALKQGMNQEQNQNDGDFDAEMGGLPPETQQALSTVYEHLVAPMEDQMNQQMDSFKSDILDLLEPLVNNVQIQSITSKNPDLAEFDLEDFRQQLSSEYGAFVPLKMAAQILEGQVSAEKASKDKEAEFTRKRNAFVPSNSGGAPPAGLKKYDPKKDGSKSIADLLREGFNELG